jgi:hypothetical protein
MFDYNSIMDMYNNVAPYICDGLLAASFVALPIIAYRLLKHPTIGVKIPVNETSTNNEIPKANDTLDYRLE